MRLHFRCVFISVGQRCIKYYEMRYLYSMAFEVIISQIENTHWFVYFMIMSWTHSTNTHIGTIAFFVITSFFVFFFCRRKEDEDCEAVELRSEKSLCSTCVHAFMRLQFLHTVIPCNHEKKQQQQQQKWSISCHSTLTTRHTAKI